MATESFMSLRRFAGTISTLLFGCACLVGVPAAAGQTSAVVSSSVAALPHTGPYGALWQTAVSTHGDYVVFDFTNTAIYDFPANGGPVVAISAAGKLAGGFSDSGIAIDPRNNNLYVDNNFNSGLTEFPYDAATGLWDLPSVSVAGALNGNLGGSCGNYFQSVGLAINAGGLMAIATENGCGVEIFTTQIDAQGNFGDATPVIANLQARARDVAIDNTGNIYFDEDGGAPGALLVPAGTTGLSGDSKGSIEATLTRVDPNLPNVLGVSVDATGNLYVSDGNDGVFLVPLVAGVPTPSQAVMLTPAPAQGNAVPAPAGAVLFEPVQGVTGISDVAKVYLNAANVGSATVGSQTAAPGTVYYSFTPMGANPTITPAKYQILENGLVAPDFTVAGSGTCDTTGQTAYPYTTTTTTKGVTTSTVTTSCTLGIAFTPSHLGVSTAQLMMLDASGNVLATTALQGIGQGSASSISPTAPAAILESGLNTPSQVATDQVGDLFVADPGLGQIIEYGPASTGSSAVLQTIPLKAPTGVAVDGAGDLYVADSGEIVEYPMVFPVYTVDNSVTPPTSTLNKGTGVLNLTAPITIATGLGTDLKLAVDGVGDVYALDPGNAQVLEFSNAGGSVGILGPLESAITGFTAPSAIAIDNNNYLYVADGTNLIKVSGPNALTTLVSSANGPLSGIGVDAAGDLYAAEPNNVLLIPNVAGVFTAANAISLDTAIAAPAGLALDAAANVYVLDGTAKTLDLISTNGVLNLGTLPTDTSTSTADATITNVGNSPLNVSGFASNNAVDYTETATTCTGAVAPGTACTATVEFNPGPGEEGPLTGSIAVASDAVNSPGSISVSGVGAPLLPTVSSITVNASVGTNVPVTVTVVPASGTGVPTGNVTVSVGGMNSPLQLPVTVALVNGSATFNLAFVGYGADVFTVAYNGDRTYGRSKASTTATITAASTTLATPTPPAYVLSVGTGAEEPYSIGNTAYTNYIVQVGNGVNVPTGTVTFWEGNSLVCDANAASIDPGLAAGTVKPVTPDLFYDTMDSTGKYMYLSAATVAVDMNGMASFATNCLAVNPNNNTTSPNELYTHTLVAVYNGDDVNAGSVSAPFKITVLRGPSVAITSNPPSVSLSAGSTTTAQLTLTSVLGYGDTADGNAGYNQQLNNYTLPLELQCDGLPARATCSFSSSSVTVAPGAPGTVTMTINTNVSASTSASLERRPGTVAFAALFGAGLLGFAVRRRRAGWKASLTLMAALVMLSGMVVGMTSCTSQDLTTAPDLTTPTGTYQVTVTAKQIGTASIPGSTAGSTLPIYGNQNEVSLPFTMNVTIK